MDDGKKMRGTLWDSLEMAHIRNSLILVTLTVLAAGGVSLLTGKYPGKGAFAFWMSAILLVPAWSYFGLRIWRIFRRSGDYILCKGKLSKLHGGKFRYTMYFTVVLESPQGEKFVVDTHEIFLTHGLQGPLVEDYVNRVVTIAYNQTTEEVVVIG